MYLISDHLAPTHPEVKVLGSRSPLITQEGRIHLPRLARAPNARVFFPCASVSDDDDTRVGPSEVGGYTKEESSVIFEDD